MHDEPVNEDRSVASLLACVAEEFCGRLARGEHARVEEYAQRYPQIASVVREVLPALQAIRALRTMTGIHDPPAAEPSPTGMFGDYRLIREIGRGGMGVVYEAEQISAGRRVALKVLSFAGVLDRRRLQRFENEARAAAQLHHRNIVPVLSVGCEQGIHYYAMQYVDGRSLSDVIRELQRINSGEAPEERSQAGLGIRDSRFEIRDSAFESRDSRAGATRDRPVGTGSTRAVGFAVGADAGGIPETRRAKDSTHGRTYFHAIVDLALQAADALGHAHERGVIHRDIKPSNLLLDTTGRLWITDFGLAALPSASGLTRTGDLVGTIRYMSPEQALAGRAPVDHRTDIYSLGATLYELLALQPARAGSDLLELLRQIAFEEPRPVRRYDPAIPRELETVIDKAMARDPADRYGTTQELAEDLLRFREGKPIVARPPTVLDRATRWWWRRRANADKRAPGEPDPE